MQQDISAPSRMLQASMQLGNLGGGGGGGSGGCCKPAQAGATAGLKGVKMFV